MTRLGSGRESAASVLFQHLLHTYTSSEHRLHSKKLLSDHRKRTVKPYFRSGWDAIGERSNVEDDHIPFKNLQVPIVHVIPLPFPKVWHKKSDNKDAIDTNGSISPVLLPAFIVVNDLALIFRVVVAEYFGLSLAL